VIRPVLRQKFVHLEHWVNFGTPNPLELLSLVAFFAEVPEIAHLPLRLESILPTLHRQLARVSLEEVHFALCNPAAADPWDTFTAGTSPHDPASHLRRALGEPPEDVELVSNPFFTTLFFERERPDTLPMIEAVSELAKVVIISTASKSRTQALYDALCSRDGKGRTVGVPRVNYISEIPKLDAVRRFIAKGHRRNRPLRLLLRGNIYDL
jgi:hypothetical protein